MVTFSFIFLSILSLIAMSGSYLLLKSKELSQKEKLFLFISIFISFSFVTFLNEHSQPSNLHEIMLLNNQNNQTNNSQANALWEVLYQEDIKALEKKFYLLGPHYITMNKQNKLPITKSFQDYLIEKLEIKQKIKEKSFFYWIESEQNIGVSFTLREFFKKLKAENFNLPILYIDLADTHEFIVDKLDYILKIPNIKVLEQVLDKMSNNFLTPYLIFDSFDRSFTSSKKNNCKINFQNLFSLKSSFEIFNEISACKAQHNSKIYDLLLNLFKKYDLKIITVNYGKNKILKDFPHFIEKRKIKTKDLNWENYLEETMNDYIPEIEAKFDKTNILQWKENLELDLRILNEYYDKYKIYKNPGKFFNETLIKTRNFLKNKGENIWNFLRQSFKFNSEINCSIIDKKILLNALETDIIRTLIDEQILEKEKNFISLCNRTIISSLKN